MLIFGASVSDWQEKAAYALDKADNEFSEVRDIRCEGIDDVSTAMATMAAFATATNCRDFIYHATINLYCGERLTPAQWMKAVNLLEKELNLTDHHRIAFEHIKKDRQHYHIYWNRVPPHGSSAVNMGNDWYKCERVAKELEKELGLKPAPRRGKGQKSEKKREIEDKNSRIRVDPKIVTKDATRIFHNSKNVKDFIPNLAREGYTLARSKKHKLVLLDRQGGYHGLLRRLEGIKLGDVRKKFPDLEKTPLPGLGAALGNARKPASSESFKRVARTFTKVASKSRGNSKGMGRMPRPFASAISYIKQHYQKPEKKYYPAPFMRKRRKKKVENELSKPVINLKEIENAELLDWAWNNKRPDILMQFGISLPPDFFEP